jgi:glycosyltransferase involved in cell wall biosynthesis
LEAFACGVPVVATSLGGLPELTEGGCGVTVPPEDPDALARALGRLLADPSGAAAMGRAARARAERHFLPDRHLAGLERLYERAARSRQRGRRPAWATPTQPRRGREGRERPETGTGVSG